MSKNGKNRDELADIRETMRMVSLQTAENAKQIGQTNRQIAQTDRQISQMGKVHDREMKEIRALFKQMIKRLAV